MTAFLRSLRWTIVLSLPVVVGACCGLEEQKHACQKASDCLVPYVCCLNPESSFDTPDNTCVPRTICKEYVPFLVEGNPCHRIDTYTDPCREPLACCNGTLTCRATEDCPPVVPSPPTPASTNESCAGDPDCRDGLVCCGIDVDDRWGQCKTLSDCRAEVGIEEVPDAGPEAGPDADAGYDAETGADADPDADGGSLAAQICELAYCDEAGPISPSSEQLAECLFQFDSGQTLATDECLASVSRVTTMCEYAFRWRNDIEPQLLPVLPATCLTTAPTASATSLTLACQKLESCGRWPHGLADCIGDLEALRYDTLSRIWDTNGCDFDVVHMGVSPGTLGDRCEGDGDCIGLTCVADGGHGMCLSQAFCDNNAETSWSGNWCMPTCTSGLQGTGGVPESDDSLIALDSDCASRMKRSLTAIGDLGCHEVTQPQSIASCVPVVDVDRCAPDTVVVANPENPLAIRGALQCAPGNAGGIGWLGTCTVGPPNTCEIGDCLLTPGGSAVCSLPCVAVGPTATYNGCPSEHVCVASGWGTVGLCLPTCPAGTCTTWGTTCVQDWPEPYCLD